MSAALPSQPADGTTRPQVATALGAARTRLWLVGLLFALTGLAWWWTADRMPGMQAGPSANLGTLTWFLGTWSVMMAAMMLPSVAPTVALYARMTRRRSVSRPLLFTGGYLLVWGSSGALAYGLVQAGRALAGGLSWQAGGRWLIAAVLTAAALYQLSPLKDLCLTRCRSPLGFLLGSWRDGRRGALQMGCRQAAWCIGCCWALMAALFALGVMSLVWMAFFSGLIALEKTLPRARAARWSGAAILLALALAVIAAPGAIPGFVVPHEAAGMSSM